MHQLGAHEAARGHSDRSWASEELVFFCECRGVRIIMLARLLKGNELTNPTSKIALFNHYSADTNVA